MAALLREEPVAAVGRTHRKRDQAEVRFGRRRWPERQLYKVQLTFDCDWAVSVIQRLLACLANWWQRPMGAGGGSLSERLVYLGT